MAKEGFRITYATMSADNDELHEAYDKGIEVARSWLGQKHPLYVNGEAREGSGSREARSPIDGTLLTKDIELLQGVYVNAGTDFAVVGTTDAWDVLVHIHEKEVGKLENLFKERGSIEVRFILYTHNQTELSGKVVDKSQFSQIAYPHERENAVKENAFILTLPNVTAAATNSSRVIS